MVDLLFWRFADKSPDHNAKSLFDSAQPPTSTQINFKMEDTQVKKTLVICLALLVFASMTALAATKGTTVTINGGKMTIAMQPGTIHPAASRPAKLKTIYSNLGTGTDVYNCCSGWTIGGSSGPAGEQWIAMPFTPKKASTVKQIDVAVGYVEGTNEIVISLDADTSGLPGKTIHKWHFKNMPTFGSCCTLDTVKYAKGLKVKAKKQYWVTVTTDTTDADLWGAWNQVWNGATGGWAFSTNGGAWTATSGTLGAYNVLGTIP